MNPVHILLIALLLGGGKLGGGVVDRLGVPGPLMFNKVQYKLAYSAKQRENYYLQQYLPEGDTLSHFRQMLGLHVFTVSGTAEEAMKQKGRELKERQKTDVVCHYQVTQSPHGKEFVLDFITSESEDGDKPKWVEFSIYHYAPAVLFDKRKEVVIYTYSKRVYGEEVLPFMRSFADERPKYLDEMVRIGLPVVIKTDVPVK